MTAHVDVECLVVRENRKGEVIVEQGTACEIRQGGVVLYKGRCREFFPMHVVHSVTWEEPSEEA